jgi:outer membrane receptor protein involved in Fe transport
MLEYERNGWDIGANLLVASGSFLHGNENNANQAGGTNGAGAYISGTGWIPGYAVVNLHGSCRITNNLEIFARLVNLFDREYSTAGFLTSSSFNPDGSFIPNPANWTNENAVSPAQPRAVWAGLRIRLN